jgi:hypothetical protein
MSASLSLALPSMAGCPPLLEIQRSALLGLLAPLHAVQYDKCWGFHGLGLEDQQQHRHVGRGAVAAGVASRHW